MTKMTSDVAKWLHGCKTATLGEGHAAGIGARVTLEDGSVVTGRAVLVRAEWGGEVSPAEAGSADDTSMWINHRDGSWERPSKAVIANDGHYNGCVLWAIGPHILEELKVLGNRGLSGLGLDDAPHGLSVWEGRWVTVDGDNESVEARGEFRALTDDEWAAVRAGRNPWEGE